MTEPLNGADLLARIKPKLREESTQICLRPELIDRWNELNQELLESENEDRVKARLSSKDADSEGKVAKTSAKTKRIAQQIADLETEIEEHSITFRFRALPKDAWQALQAEHPPRKDNQMDTFLGYSRDGVEDAAVRECLFDPVFDDESWAELVKIINASEWSELRNTIRIANGVVSELPKSVLAAKILTKPGAAQK